MTARVVAIARPASLLVSLVRRLFAPRPPDEFCSHCGNPVNGRAPRCERRATSYSWCHGHIPASVPGPDDPKWARPFGPMCVVLGRRWG